MASRGSRDQIVLATKFSTGYKTYRGPELIQSNYGGNGTKSMRQSLRDSLKKLQTTYVDVLYLHWWDYTASIPELMLGLNDLVASGKVNYLGVSDTPAWVVAQANQYARDHGLRQFTVYQGMWSGGDARL
jgi:aryl-alcohol dehydrogenase-like predicted oxidoreductase